MSREIVLDSFLWFYIGWVSCYLFSLAMYWIIKDSHKKIFDKDR